MVMATTSHVLMAEQQATTAVLPTGTAPWIALGQTFARWTLWATVLVTGFVGFEYDPGLGRPAGFLVLAFLGFAFVSLGDGLVSLLWKLLHFLLPRLRLARAAEVLRPIPPAMIGRILGVFVFIAGDMLWPDSFFKNITLPPVGEMAILLVGISGTWLIWVRQSPRFARRYNALVAIPLLLNVAFLTWVFLPGTDGYLAHTGITGIAPAPSLPDPSLPGIYAVRTLSYGNGVSNRRPEFGSAAALTTTAVDGSPLFAGYAGLGGSYYRWYWGFDFTQLPLNGLVWYPDGTGPFPLVLIVHGNHAMTEASDPGYAYLAEHLAAHGYIAVSVDENFLNGFMFIDGNMAEVPLRAWILLKHVQVWQAWNEAPDNPFYGLVDLDRVALIGHSRGGEAVAAAAVMNWEGAPPAVAAGDFGYGIKAIVALAPSDGNDKPGNRFLTPTHSNYLLLAGGHDADTYLLYGQAQYNRVRFDDNPDGFKALAYLYQGNHGQFNTVWANRDRGWLNSLLLNRRPLLDGEAQRQAAEVLVTAFLEASLRGQDGYRTLFANPPAGNAWLPAGIVVTQYEAASFVPVDTNRNGTAATRLDVRGGQAILEGFSEVHTTPLLLRDGETKQQNSALYLAWEAGSQPSLTINLGQPMGLTADQFLTFALASAMDEASPIEGTVDLETHDGQTARLQLHQFGPVYPPLPAHLVKAPWLAPLPGYKMTLVSPFERVLQTYTLPLATFQVANPAFRPDDLQVIRFRFGGNTAGAAYLDQVGFCAPQTTATRGE
jgi:dienelactone hydrolase